MEMSRKHALHSFERHAEVKGQLLTRGGAGGGLGGYSPPWEHASPPSEGEKRFFRRFLAFTVP